MAGFNAPRDTFDRKSLVNDTAAPADTHLGPLTHQTLDDGGADPAAAASHQGTLVLQNEGRGFPPFGCRF